MNNEDENENENENEKDGKMEEKNLVVRKR